MSCQAPEPQREHRWLQQLVGDWAYEGECSMGPDKSPESFAGTESVRSVGDLWIMGESHGTMPGGEPATSFITLGFDPRQQRFVGTWFGSMMAHLWIYDGALDEAAKVLTLESDGPGFEDQTKTARYRDVYELKSDGHRVLTASVRGDDGNWATFMISHYRRK
ncbi:MAG: DUF1579 domain-containing protein [Planctomycetaceae bacterium]